MKALATTLRNLPLATRVETWTLHKCLARMGVPKRRFRATSQTFGQAKSSSAGYFLRRSTPNQLHDLFDEAKGIYRGGCKEIQTQFTENHELAANWNALWDRTESLLLRKISGRTFSTLTRESVCECGKFKDPKSVMCADCRNRLPRPRNPKRCICGKPIRSRAFECGVCRRARKGHFRPTSTNFRTGRRNFF